MTDLGLTGNSMANNSIKVSVITVNFNDARGLENTLASTMAQTEREGWEQIVIDGGSTDGSKEVIEIQRSACLRRKRTRRRHLSRNEQGSGCAKGEYCLFRTRQTPRRRQCRKRSHSTGCADYYVGNMLRMGRKTSLVTSPDDLTAAYLAQRSLPHQAMFIRTSLLRHRPYQTQYRIVADWEQQVWELVLHNASYQHLNAVVARFDANGVSNTQREKSDKERRQIHDTLFSRSLTASLNGRDKYEKRLFLHHSKDIPVGVCTETHGAAHQMDAAFITVGTVFIMPTSASRLFSP